MRALRDPRQHRARGRTIARERVGDKDARHAATALEQPAEEALGRLLVPCRSHQDSEHVARLILGSPPVRDRAMDWAEDLVEMPRIAGWQAPAPEVGSIARGEGAPALPQRCAGHREAARGKQVFDSTVAEGARAIKPEGGGEDRGRKAGAVGGSSRGSNHAAIIRWCRNSLP